MVLALGTLIFGLLLGVVLMAMNGRAARVSAEQLSRLAEAQRAADRESAERVIAPIADTLRKVEAQMTSLDRDRRQAQGQTGELFEQMRRQVDQLRGETGQLVTALRRPQVRGSWGEMQLRNCVEAAGMTAHVDFTEQESVATEDGRLRPDMVVRMPGGGTVVVDSKVPLDAYLDAVALEDGAARQAKLTQHAGQLRRHLDQLSGKAYQSQFGTSPEFVVCFVPNDVIFGAAMTADPTLLEYGAGRRVLLATPATLMALLYAVAYGWTQERVAEEARELAALAQELHKRAGAFLDPLQQVGRQLGRAVDSYNRAVGSMEARFLPQLRRMEQTGALGSATLEAPEAVDAHPRAITAAEVETEAALLEDAVPGR